MTKSMKKTIFALCIALSVFMCNSTFALAAVCNLSPDGVHHFSAHEQGVRFTVDGGFHEYLYGYDSQNRPIYKNDCKITYNNSYCNYVCKHCYIKQDNGQHTHSGSTSHSISHK